MRRDWVMPIKKWPLLLGFSSWLNPTSYKIEVPDGAHMLAYGVDDFVLHGRDREVVAGGFDDGEGRLICCTVV